MSLSSHPASKGLLSVDVKAVSFQSGKPVEEA